MNKILVFFLSLLLVGCPFSKGDLSNAYEGRMSNKYATHTQKGVSVRSPNKIENDRLIAIDKGLDKAFAIAEAPPNNYVGFSRHNTYIVWLWPRSNKCENPAIYQFWKSDNHPYDQTEYDKEPEKGKIGLCFAGAQRSNGIGGDPNARPGMLVVDDPVAIENVVWFEAEHNIVYQVDLKKWFDTMGSNHYHPFLGYGQTTSSSLQFEEFTFEYNGDTYTGLLTK